MAQEASASYTLEEGYFIWHYGLHLKRSLGPIRPDVEQEIQKEIDFLETDVKDTVIKTAVRKLVEADDRLGFWFSNGQNMFRLYIEEAPAYLISAYALGEPNMMDIVGLQNFVSELVFKGYVHVTKPRDKEMPYLTAIAFKLSQLTVGDYAHRLQRGDSIEAAIAGTVRPENFLTIADKVRATLPQFF